MLFLVNIEYYIFGWDKLDVCFEIGKIGGKVVDKEKDRMKGREVRRGGEIRLCKGIKDGSLVV